MSAPSLMCRTAILILALAMGPVAFASGTASAAPDAPLRPAIPHRKTAERHGPRETAHARHSVYEHHTTHERPAHLAGHSQVARSSHRLAADRASTRRLARETHLAPHSRIAEQRSAVLHREGTPAEEARRTTELNIERQRIEPVSEVRTAREMAAPDAAAGESSRAEPRDPPAMEVPAIESAEAPAARNDALGSLSEPASLDIAGMPPPLRGSLASLERQDQRLEADGLERIEDEDDLSARIQHHLLVPLPVSDALTVNAELLPHHRYCRPWTARFLTDLARAHEAEFHRPLEVSSAVRPVAYQARLMRINGNAAPAEGDLVSPHVMGATIDIAKKQMSREEIAWMRRHLLALEVAGKIDVEEEFEQACFHITVYRDYVPARPRVPREPETEATGEGTGD